jgi:hypothetical protein
MPSPLIFIRSPKWISQYITIAWRPAAISPCGQNQNAATRNRGPLMRQHATLRAKQEGSQGDPKPTFT